jgi:hypothetical protein
MSQEKVKLGRVTAVVALAAVLALVLAGCGDDDEQMTTETAQDEIERVGNNWARLFAADAFGDSCESMIQPFCERIDCERASGQPIPNCKPPSAEFRSSFEGATVEDVVIRGDNAGARFSNGEVVELVEEAPTQWLIRKFGQDAGGKFFD